MTTVSWSYSTDHSGTPVRRTVGPARGGGGHFCGGGRARLQRGVWRGAQPTWLRVLQHLALLTQLGKAANDVEGGRLRLVQHVQIPEHEGLGDPLEDRNARERPRRQLGNGRPVELIRDAPLLNGDCRAQAGQGAGSRKGGRVRREGCAEA